MIPEEMIMKHLDSLLASSDPGASLHHLHVVSCGANDLGPLGTPAEDKLETTIYAILADMPDDSKETAEEFAARVIRMAAREHLRARKVIVWAGISLEMVTVSKDDPAHALAAQLHAQGRLAEHPNVIEATAIYAACIDGRRWRGVRWLTGPNAGTSEDVDVLVGPPQRGESMRVGVEQFVRALVGIKG